MTDLLFSRRHIILPLLSYSQALSGVGAPLPGRPADAIGPEAFGARGDGVHDDAEAIARSLQMGHPVWLSSGRRYLARSPIELHSGSRLSSDGTATILRGADGPLLQIRGASDVELRGVRLFGGGRNLGSTTAAEILIDWRSVAGARVSLRDLAIFDVPAAGILALASSATRSRGLSIRNCTVVNAGAHGIIAQDFIDEVLIENCLVEATGLRVADRPGITASRYGRGVTIRNNVCHGSASAIGRSVHGISLDMCEDVHAVGNSCDGWPGFGIEIAGVKNGIVERNYLSRNVYGIAGSGLGEKFHNDNILITRNEISNQLECGMYFFINKNKESERHIDINIVDNKIYDVSGNSIGVGILLNDIDGLEIASDLIVGTSASGIYLNDCEHVRIHSVSMRGINKSVRAGHGGVVVEGGVEVMSNLEISDMTFEEVIGPKQRIVRRPPIASAE